MSDSNNGSAKESSSVAEMEVGFVIITCNTNRKTDDTYDVYLNENNVGTVPRRGGPGLGSTTDSHDCDSPAYGGWITNVPTLEPADIDPGGMDCQPCLEDNDWTVINLPPYSYPMPEIHLRLIATEDAGCGDEGSVEVYKIVHVISTDTWIVTKLNLVSMYGSEYNNKYAYISDDGFHYFWPLIYDGYFYP
jgi:hypothetical protein